MPRHSHQTPKRKEDPRKNKETGKEISTPAVGGRLKKLLFVCVANAGRSQMAEAFANNYGKGKLTASSAGNKPADK